MVSFATPRLSFKSQTLMTWSLCPEYNQPPSSLRTRESAGSACWPNVKRVVPDARSHTLMVRSRLLENSHLPSVEKERLCTAEAWPRSVAVSLPAATSQTLMVESSPAEYNR